MSFSRLTLVSFRNYDSQGDSGSVHTENALKNNVNDILIDKMEKVINDLIRYVRLAIVSGFKFIFISI